MDEQTFFLCFEGSGVRVTAEARPKPGCRVELSGDAESGRQALSVAVPSGVAMLPHRRPYRASMFAGNDVLRGRFRERHLRSHALRMFAAQMPIYFQRQHSAVTMPQPTRDGWNINPTLNAAGRKKVPQGVVRQPSTTDKPARPGQSALAF